MPIARRPTPLLPTAVVLVLVLVLVAGACADDGDGARAPTGATGPTNETGPSPSPPEEPSPSESPSPSGSPSPALEDGLHFGFLTAVDVARRTLELDLAYFLTGDEANEAAAERGDETPVPNDYYIVNDNPRLRTLALGDDLRLVLLDWSRCCDETFRGELEPFATAVNEVEAVTVDGRVYQPGSPFWLTVAGGVVTRIEEQYLP
jgi:hypothetical protein